ncbi:MAG TPA: carbamoyltransferase N-terminal domain-containing protein [Nitrospiraceae bacterium]|nr:carbamoyltransferase N-terminal domain-containing protein [Nitrospiraceae bacterium]
MDNHNDREALESGTNLRFGVSACFHDSAAYLVRDDDIVSAAQEERFTRKKHDPGFPHRAIDYCQKAGEIGLRWMSSAGELCVVQDGSEAA